MFFVSQLLQFFQQASALVMAVSKMKGSRPQLSGNGVERCSIFELTLPRDPHGYKTSIGKGLKQGRCK